MSSLCMEHINCIRSRKYRKKHLKVMRQYNSNYNKTKGKERILEYMRKYRATQHRDLIQLVGDSKCSRCGFADIRALQIDHINGGGHKEYQKFRNATQMFRYYLRRPDEVRNKLQVLCANCNWIKRVENKELWRLPENLVAQLRAKK